MSISVLSCCEPGWVSTCCACATLHPKLSSHTFNSPAHTLLPPVDLRLLCIIHPPTRLQEGFVHLAQHGRLTLDSRKIKGEVEDFLQKENRFSTLTRKNPEASARLHHHLQV